MEVGKSLVELLLLELVFGTIEHCKTGEREDIQEMVFYRLEQLGHSMGHKMALKYADALVVSDDNQLDVVKLICKEFWQFIFGKQIDTLKTNHRGVFVLTDQNMQLLHPFLNEPTHIDTPSLTILYMALPCGLLRGALTAFNLKSVVRAQLSAFPICTFDVQIIVNQ